MASELRPAQPPTIDDSVFKVGNKSKLSIEAIKARSKVSSKELEKKRKKNLSFELIKAFDYYYMRKKMVTLLTD